MLMLSKFLKMIKLDRNMSQFRLIV